MIKIHTKRQLTRAGYVAMAVFVLVFGTSAIADDTNPFEDITVAFELTAGDGELVTMDKFKGKHVLLTFGFTSCGHICPMTVAKMAAAIKSSDTAAAGVFISVDTERDSPQIAGEYASNFSEAIVGLSGSHEQVSAAANNFKVTFVVTKSQESYTVQHTQVIFLIGPDGVLLDTFALNAPVKQILGAMR